ncbi:MAG: CGNR zinc finger domain-containing protein [Solirubrobacteraceae bacterium]
MPESLNDRIEIVRDFVNTYELEADDEQLATPAALIAWLRDHGLGEPQAGPSDLKRALELREALRAMLLHHNGHGLDPQAPHVLDAAAERARLSVCVGEDGAVRLEPRAGGVDGALGRLLAAVADAERDGSWSRLKVCAADSCRWAFYDASRNRSGTWCDMKVCGNREKVRSFRARHG